jgi:uroporphyrinogen-III synthase
VTPATAEPQVSRTLWIGRDAQSAASWIAAAQAAGWQAQALPLIERQAIHPHGDDAAVLDDFHAGDWLFLTSPAAVQLGLRPLISAWPMLLRARIAVVGPGTAAALQNLPPEPGEALRSAVELQAAGRGGMALAIEFLKRFGPADSGSRPLFWLRAKHPRPELEAILHGAGWPVHGLAVYRTEGVPGPSPAAGQPILLFSPSGARALSQRVQVPSAHPILALGATTAEAARELGFAVSGELAAPKPQALLDFLV